jgi:hypothetical protein
MRDKVATSSIRSCSTIIDTAVPVPTNVLSPPTRSSDFTPLLVSSTNNSMNDGNVTTTQFNTSSNVQPVILDHYDIPPPLDNPSYTHLQSYSTDDVYDAPPLDNPSYTHLQSYSTDDVYDVPPHNNPSYTDLQSYSTDDVFDGPSLNNLSYTNLQSYSTDVVVDGPPLNNPSYTDLQSCSTDVIFKQQETNQTNRKNVFNTGKI